MYVKSTQVSKTFTKEERTVHCVTCCKSKEDELPFVVGTAPSVSEFVSSGNYFLVEAFQSVRKQRTLIIHYIVEEG